MTLQKNNFFLEQFEFRNIKMEEADQAVCIEQTCFPPHEACSEKNIKERINKASDFFLVAVQKETGKIAGFLNGIATQEEHFQDKFFINASLHNKDGANVMLLGLDVLPQYRGQGLATELVKQYVKREKEKGRKTLILTCLEEKVQMYQKMGFFDDGIADSSWGGEEWHQMHFSI